MTISQKITPLMLDDPRKAMVGAHTYLRELIHNNTLPAGTIISQVELANALGVSRTPLREALRRLQEEGLIESEANRRCRVTGYRPEDLDSVYGTRLLVEALAMRISVPLLRPNEVDELGHMLGAMDEASLASREQGNGPNEDWRRIHRLFHFKMVSKAPPTLLAQYEALVMRSERYFLGMINTRHFQTLGREAEHVDLVNLVKAGNIDRLIVSTAEHRARTAVALLADVAVDFEPVAIRAALRMITAEADASSVWRSAA